MMTKLNIGCLFKPGFLGAESGNHQKPLKHYDN